MWVDRHRDVSVSESEGDDVSSAAKPLMRRVPRPGAFQPVQPAHVTQTPPRREKRSQRKRGANRDAQPEPSDAYLPTAKLWMEQVDNKAVQKSKTMYLTAMPEGFEPPPELENVARPYEGGAGGDEALLRPLWVIARGRPRRRRGGSNRESSMSLGATSGESDVEGFIDRPFSPGRQMLLFFR